MKKEGLHMCNPELKSKQNDHIRHFPNHINPSLYLVIFHNNNKQIQDLAKSNHSQNNAAHFITNSSCSVKTIAAQLKQLLLNQNKSNHGESGKIYCAYTTNV